MFLGLKLLFLLLITPIVIGIFLYALKRKSRLIGRVILTIYALGTSFFIITSVVSLLAQKKVLDKTDFYGEYVIDRNYFAGKQADWQYNHYRFEIKENDSIYFKVTDGKKILKIYKGKISTIEPYNSARLVINMKETGHHVLNSNPIIYRQAWNFFMVFNSPKYHNMYFKKDKWLEIN